MNQTNHGSASHARGREDKIERSTSVAILAVEDGVRRILGCDFDEKGRTVGGMGYIGNDGAVVAQLRKL